MIRRSLIINIRVNKKAVLLAAAARTAEVAELKRDLEQVHGELEENKGK